jgi:hypothetical protein
MEFDGGYAAGEVRQEGKRFFFEKKKQKTFGPAGAGTRPVQSQTRGSSWPGLTGPSTPFRLQNIVSRFVASRSSQEAYA